MIHRLKRRYFVLLLTVFTLFIGCQPNNPNTPSADAIWPTDGWRTSTPEQQGIDSETLAALFETIDERGYAIDSVTIVRNGYIVADAAIAPFRPNQRHIIFSCTKSVVSALIGIAIDKGYIDSVEQPLLDFFPEIKPVNLDGDKRAITLEHVLMMATGLECRDSYLHDWRGIREMHATEDWVQYMLDLPMEAEPGTRFEYCNGASFLLSAIVQETTGMTALDFAKEHLFAPLGIKDVDWKANPQGITIGYSELYLHPHAMAKFGYLYLNEGQWDGQQIIPADWVAASTRKQTSAKTLQEGYGYQWWIASDAYMALGYSGQYIVVVPEMDLVVVFTSDLPSAQFFVPEQLLDTYIVPAVMADDPLPENPDGAARLQESITVLTKN